MLSTLFFFKNCLKNKLKSFNYGGQAWRTNFRWPFLKYICGWVLYPETMGIILALLIVVLFSYMIIVVEMFWVENQIVILFRKYTYFIVGMAPLIINDHFRQVWKTILPTPWAIEYLKLWESISRIKMTEILISGNSWETKLLLLPSPKPCKLNSINLKKNYWVWMERWTESATDFWIKISKGIDFLKIIAFFNSNKWDFKIENWVIELLVINDY